MLQAEPTHELIREYQNDTLILPVGTRVEVMTESGSDAIAKVTSDKGSVSVVQLPSSSLKKIAPAAEAPVVPVAAVPVEKPPTPVASASIPTEQPSNPTPPSSGVGGALVPGETITLTFPELGASYQSDPAQVQIRIPENYRPDQPVPLALFFGGGQGTENPGNLKNLVDPATHVLVAFPYPKNVPLPRLAIEAGKSKEIIDFQKPMLERLQKLLPNTDPKRRVVIGFSSGAHMIGIASCDGWKEFTEYFSAFVMDEGGSSQGRDFKALKRKDVMFVMGEKSPHRDYNLGMVKRLEDAKLKPYIFEAPGEGHEMGESSQKAIKEWLSSLKTQ